MGLSKHWVTEIFKVFQSRYFNKFSKQIEGIEERAIAEWSRGLGDVNGEQVRQGLDNWTSDWPPSLGEFRACCLGIEEKSEHTSIAYKSYKRCLPAPKNFDLARKQMANIKNLLK